MGDFWVGMGFEMVEELGFEDLENVESEFFCLHEGEERV
jgi:hypothetical protein